MRVRTAFLASIVAVTILAALIAGGMLLVFHPAELAIVYPFDDTLFPADIIAPVFRWSDSSGSDSWDIRIDIPGEESLQFGAKTTVWTPDDANWDWIKQHTLDASALVTINGYRTFLGFHIVRSRQTVSFATSPDVVGAPIFFRDVPLPFDYAVQHMEEIIWRIGDVGTKTPPGVVLDHMAVCGNCHSFSANGQMIGMDVDYANDKGSYVIADFSDHIDLSQDSIISWSDYHSEDSEQTYGLLSQVSPDGRYVISTVKDKSVFVPIDNLEYSQLFFPIKGILVYYDSVDGTYHALPGADDRTFVQSNPTWSPDGASVVFARSKVGHIKIDNGTALLAVEDCENYVSREELFLYDLYRVPFNNGAGGNPEPIPGASNNGKSNYFPRYSPDGKWIVFCQAESFMLLQKDSKLFIMPAEGGIPREMNCNTPNMNSWHSWSPNGKWLVFVSKAFGPYSQLFLTHIDENGNDSPPVLLHNFTTADRAANIPEFVNVDPSFTCVMDENFIDDYSYLRSGEMYFNTYKDYETAAEEYRKALAINPENVEALIKLGNSLELQGVIDEAEKVFDKVLGIQPDNVYAWSNLGSIHEYRKEFEAAEDAYRHILTIAPEDYFAYHKLGYLCLNQERYQEAEEMFLDLKRINESYSSEETTDAVTSASVREYRYRMHGNLGTLYWITGRYELAEEELQQAIAHAPDDPTAYLTLGHVYLDEGRQNEALTQFNRVLSLDPQNQDAQKSVDFLRQAQAM